MSRASSAVIGFLELDVDRLGMADEHRHAHAGRGELDLRVEDLLGLDHHLPFFLGRAVLHEDVDVGMTLKAICLGTSAARPPGIGDVDALGLVQSSSIASLPAPETDW
jgi:hypothetical protein